MSKPIEKQRILSVIPARGGSKELPRKNLQFCGGVPLIQWTIEASKLSSYVTDTLVTTDSEAISGVATKAGAWVPFLRDGALAKDDSSIISVIEDVLEKLRKLKHSYDYVLMLQPTSPLRTAQHIDLAVSHYFENRRSVMDTMFSARTVDSKYCWLFETGSGTGYARPLLDLDLNNPRRQELPQCCIPNGAIYMAPTQEFKGFYGKRSVIYLMDDTSSIDIDNRKDLDMANAILNTELRSI